ncbi:MAG: TolC family protein [Myxococcota bacterium]|nr:TolC family protein [Myxococcota bacterium]
MPGLSPATLFQRLRRASAFSAVPWLALGLVVLSSGCSTYERMPLDPGEEWSVLLNRSQKPDPVDPPPNRATENWQWFPLTTEVDTSDGVSLAEANAIALLYNPGVVRSRHEVGATTAWALQAGVLENPELFFGPRLSTLSSDVIVPISLSWELPLWGKRQAREDVAVAESRQAQLNLLARELEVLVEIRNVYIRIRRVDRELAIIESLDRTTGLVSEWAKRLQRSGEIDQTAAWLASWEQNQVKMLQLEKQGERRRLVGQWFEALGLLPSANLEANVAGVDQVPELSATSLDERRRHPAIRIAAELYEVSQAELRLEIAKQYPDFRLGPEFEDDASDSSIGFGLGIELPLFDRNRGGIGAAEERSHAAREHYRAALLASSHEEARARAAAATASDLLELLRAGPAQQAEEALRALQGRLELGVSSVLEVLATQRALTEARLQEIRLEAELSEAIFSASVASGSAFQEPPTKPSEERKP